MASLTISVPDDLRDFVDRRARETHHVSPAEYIQSLIRQDQQRTAEQRLETRLIEGLDSGNPVLIENLGDHFDRKKHALMDRARRAERPATASNRRCGFTTQSMPHTR